MSKVLYMTIGGQLPTLSLMEFAEALRLESCLYIDDNPATNLDQILKALNEHDTQTPLKLELDVIYDFNDGIPVRPENIEDLCEENNLPYTILYPPVYTEDVAYNQMLVYWLPLMELPLPLLVHEGKIAIGQEQTLSLIDTTWRMYTKNERSDNKLIQETFDQAVKEELPFNEILKRVILNTVGHEEIIIPKFSIEQ